MTYDMIWLDLIWLKEEHDDDEDEDDDDDDENENEDEGDEDDKKDKIENKMESLELSKPSIPGN